jgi:hypothetical protein
MNGFLQISHKPFTDFVKSDMGDSLICNVLISFLLGLINFKEQYC